MKKPIIIRDSTEARQLLVQGLWWMQRLRPDANNVRRVLAWAKEAASAGQPLPPIGFIGDVGHMLLDEDAELRTNREPLQVPNLPINVVRTYEDHVLGKLDADFTFARAVDALRHYDKVKNREQARGLAYFLNQFRERADYLGIEISPGVINTLLDMPPDEVLTEGWESLRQDGPNPRLEKLYQSLIEASRGTPEALGSDDVFDLERRYALEELSQRLAHRQVLRAAAELEATLPRHKIRPLAYRAEVPTRILDEDTYPVGGFTSISNRGSVESMLHSQLAYMETDTAHRPDLFDTLYLLDELLYYSRDENQFLRRRRTFVIALAPDLVQTRFKDFELPFQRGVMLMGLLYLTVRKLVDWLSADALNFQILSTSDADNDPLAGEKAILQKLLAEEIALDVVHFNKLDLRKLGKLCEDWSRRSMVHCLVVGVDPPLVEAREVVVNRLAINGPRPYLGGGDLDELTLVEGDDAAHSWANALQGILQRWI
jgi:hypothetical protein